MSDTSRPQRIEVLGSRVGGMKAELSYIRAQIEQMMGITQQFSRPCQQTEANRKKSQAAPAGERQTMTAAAPEGHRAKKGLLAQEL